METCGVPTLTCVLLLLFTGALYASAEADDERDQGSLMDEPLLRVVRSAQRAISGNSWIGATDSARQGRIADSGGDGMGSRGRPGSRRRDRDRGRGGRNRGRGRGNARRIPNGPPTRLDRRTMGLVYRLSNASTPFALSLFAKLHPQLMTNAVFSPLSVHTAMTMTSIGARGRTQREMFRSLGLRRARLRRRREHRAYHALLTSLSYTHRDVHVSSANAVFVKPNIPLEDAFRQQVQQMYLAKFDTFSLRNPEQAINNWVANATGGKIRDLIAPGSIGRSTSMVLVNAIYLNARWAYPFDRRRTSLQEFQPANSAPRNMQMMSNTQVYRYASRQNMEVVELPYKGDRLAMYIMLPHNSSSIAELMEFVTGSEDPGQNPLEVLLSDLTPESVKVVLPKFNIESEVLDLSQDLQEMGIVKAFNRRRANFSGISVTPLYIDKVVHKAVIEVTESGTTASAATAVYLARNSFLRHTTEVKVNRPFMFLIKDKLMNAVLFMGAFLGEESQG